MARNSGSNRLAFVRAASILNACAVEVNLDLSLIRNADAEQEARLRILCQQAVSMLILSRELKTLSKPFVTLSRFRQQSRLFAFACCFGLGLPAAEASFHLMQISQVIGGVNGDTSAQAIELRMRSPGQNFLSLAPKLVVVDATGSNPITLITFSADVVQGNIGSTVLITTPNFKNYTSNPATFHSDFTMNAIPGVLSRRRSSDLSGPIRAHPLVARVWRFLLYRADERRNDQRRARSGKVCRIVAKERLAITSLYRPGNRTEQ